MTVGDREAVGASRRSVSNSTKGGRGQGELGQKRLLDLGFVGETLSRQTGEEGTEQHE